MPQVRTPDGTIRGYLNRFSTLKEAEAAKKILDGKDDLITRGNEKYKSSVRTFDAQIIHPLLPPYRAIFDREGEFERKSDCQYGVLYGATYDYFDMVIKETKKLESSVGALFLDSLRDKETEDILYTLKRRFPKLDETAALQAIRGLKMAIGEKRVVESCRELRVMDSRE